jgi:RND superfamily putative drug exporter
MFKSLGQMVIKYRIPIIVIWIGLAIILPLTAPSLDEIGTSDQRDFLPGDAPFAHAETVYQEAFPEDFTPSSGLVVVDSGEAGGVQPDTTAWTFMEDLTLWLTTDETLDNILNVGSPTSDPAIAERLIDETGRYGLVAFGLSTSDIDKRTISTVEKVDEWLDEHVPAGMTTYHTGQAAINLEGDEVMVETIDRTLLITIVLVVVFLLAIYRSPVSPFIPLFAVTVALFVTIGILGFLGDAGIFTIMTQTNALLIVVMYGAGTDYCLFLISRFREEMAESSDVKSATKDTVHLVGETITSSASTIFVGFMAMSFSEMGFFKNSGPMLATGIVVGLLAGLTLTPSLLSLLGERAFWPGGAKHRAHSRWYDFISRQSSTYPLVVIVVIVAAMLPFSAYGLSRDVTYEFMEDYPDDMESFAGYQLLEDHFGSGLLFPLTVVVTEQEPETLATNIAQLSAELKTIDGIADVLSLDNPLGAASEQYQNVLYVSTQLHIATNMLSQTLETGEADQIDDMVGAWQSYLAILAERFPAIEGNAQLLQLQEMLADPSTLTASQDEFQTSVGLLADEFMTNINAPYLMLSASPLFASFSDLEAAYLNPTGETFAYQMTIMLTEEPGHDTSLAAIADIRVVLDDYTTGGSGDAVVSGFTAVMKDVKDIIDRDLERAIAFVLAGIFLVLLVMLRSAVAPLYLIGTVLISYTFTLGITNIVFDVVFGVERLSWAVEFFMFVFLVALGIDYSIFLFGRIKEEVGYHGVREGVHVAVSSTGAIITSAGLILAGTFAGLMAGEVKFLAEVGFAVAFGVLVDTFVVRTILDPALAALFGRWTWWPGGVPQAQSEESTERGGQSLPAAGATD